MNKKQKKMLTRILIAAAMLIALQSHSGDRAFCSLRCIWSLIGIIGYDILSKAWKGILNRQVFDENFLMAVATIGAFALAIYERSGDYVEAIAVMLFYQIGELFQSYAVGKSRRNISALMDIRPDYANIERDGTAGEGRSGRGGNRQRDRRAAGRKGAAGRRRCSTGTSSLNTSALTGESLPRDVEAGRRGHQRLHQHDRRADAFGRRRNSANPPSPKFLNWWRIPALISRNPKTSSPNSPAYTRLPSATARWRWRSCRRVVRLLFMGNAAQWGEWIYRALTFLVISCPCALVISIPLSFFARHRRRQ